MRFTYCSTCILEHMLDLTRYLVLDTPGDVDRSSVLATRHRPFDKSQNCIRSPSFAYDKLVKLSRSLHRAFNRERPTKAYKQENAADYALQLGCDYY